MLAVNCSAGLSTKRGSEDLKAARGSCGSMALRRRMVDIIFATGTDVRA